MPSEAGYPFNEPTADIILRSCDNVTFRLHKIILALASEFFKDMLSLPQPGVPSSSAYNSSADTSELQVDGLPVIDVTEPGDVLERLFRLCYPVDDPVLDSITEVRSTLEAAMKYQMGEAVKITKRRLLALATTDPLRVYAVACCFGLEEEASAAAKEILRQKAQDRYVEELEDISIGAYHRLLSYCERRGRVRDRFRFTFHRSSGREHVIASTPSLSDASMDITTAEALAEPKVAPYPFDLADAEVGVITSDGVEFRIFKHILQLSSPVLFSKVTSLPDSAPMQISVPEPTRIVSILFGICYPTTEPTLSDLHDISAALAAAEKYEMQRASQALRAAMTALKDNASEDPVVLYAIACRFGMRELAISAARRTLRTEIMRSSVSELDSVGVSGGSFFRLVDYHRRCRVAVRAVCENHSSDWIEADLLTQLHNCCRKGYNAGPRNPCWYDRYMTRLAEEAWPKSESATKDELLQVVLEATRDASYSCNYCANIQGTFLLIKFSRCVADAIEAAEKGVILQWSPPLVPA